MSKEPNEGRFRLVVPLDASTIEGFKPEIGVKVGLLDRNNKVHSQVVQLDANGQGVATFTFREQPGALRLIAGPENASDEELTGLQTLTMNLEPKLWARPELALTPILITPFYWWWWLRWCRRFTINGRVLCPDGSPVPGAVVCAYDVDWWWIWSSRQQVGPCVTTDINGSFSINFRWCCGWWPWWWWRLRFWHYEPLLAEHVLPVLRTDPSFDRLRIASPTPDLSIFDSILGDRPPRPPARRAISAEVPTRFASQDVRRINTITNRQTIIDPGALEGLRDKLVKRLPRAPELERFRLWPWWPWTPWWDCSPDIIFKVTQDCEEPGKVIVDETILQARWDIPTNLSVTLTATDACCTPICLEPSDCPEGECVVINQACTVPTDNIGGNFDAPATPEGYADPGVIAAGVSSDRPFAGGIDLWGTFGSTANVDYYEFEWATSLAGPWNPMPPGAAGGFIRKFWGPDLVTGTIEWNDVPFSFTPISGRNVVESREHFEANNGAGTWGITRSWNPMRDYLMKWLTTGFADGTYYLHVLGWDLVGGNLTNDRVLPMCNLEDPNYIVLTIDNRITDGSDGHPASAPLHPCGDGTVHLCTLEPDTDIVNVTVGGQVVGPCTNVQASSGSPLVVDFYAYDADEHLSGYTLRVTFGENEERNLLDLADSIVPQPGLGVPAALRVGPTYFDALMETSPPGIESPSWAGGGLRLTINDSTQAFPIPCCYQLELRAAKRTIDSCTGSHENFSHYTFGVNACPEPPE